MLRNILYGLILYSSSLLGEPSCYHQLASHFFDDDKAIMQALSLHRVTESSWTPIVHAVQRNSHQVYQATRRQARLLDQNPLEPFNPPEAEKLLTAVLFGVFNHVLRDYLITNSSDITEMFDYIKRNQPLWIECFPPPEAPAA